MNDKSGNASRKKNTRGSFTSQLTPNRGRGVGK